MSNCYVYLTWKSYLQSLKAAMSTSSCICKFVTFVVGKTGKQKWGGEKRTLKTVSVEMHLLGII